MPPSTLETFCCPVLLITYNCLLVLVLVLVIHLFRRDDVPDFRYNIRMPEHSAHQNIQVSLYPNSYPQYTYI